MTTPLIPSLVDDQLAELGASRYHVINAGRSLWHIVDSTTGRPVGFDRHHGSAVERAKVMEMRRAS